MAKAKKPLPLRKQFKKIPKKKESDWELKKKIPTKKPTDRYKEWEKEKTPKEWTQRKQSKIDPREKYRSKLTGKLPYEDAIQASKNKAAEKKQSTRYVDDRTGPAHSGVDTSEKEPKGFLNKIRARLK